MAEKENEGRGRRFANVVWLYQSVADFDRIIDVIAHYSSGAAERASVVIPDAIDMLAQFPLLAKQLPDEVHREWPIRWGSSTIIIRYRIDADGTVIIVRLLHGRERR